MNVSPLGISSATLACAIPAQRCRVSSGQLLTACRLAWEQGGQLAALWASDERDRERGFCVHVLLRDRDGLTLLEHTLPDAERELSRSVDHLSGGESDAARGVRPGRHAVRHRRPAALDVAGSMADRSISTAARLRRVAEMGAGRRRLSVRSRIRRWRARNRRRAGARRDDRTRAFSLPGGGGESASAGGAAGLRAQGHRKTLRGAVDRRRRPVSPRGFQATAPSPTDGPTLRPSRRSRDSSLPSARPGCARCASSANALPIIWATWAISATTADSRSGFPNSRV